jgi:hypothetical protein
MTNSVDTQVQGAAVYMEFVKPGVTTQILLMPEGMSTAHRAVPMTVYRRRLSAMQPRKTWRAGASHTTSTMELTAGLAKPAPSTTEVQDVMLSFLFPLMKSMISNGYKLYKAPVIVEVTAEDLECARNSKTPYKAMARVWKARKALGFPKEYIHNSEVLADLFPNYGVSPVVI